MITDKNKWLPDMVVCDIDGTFLRGHSFVTERTKNVVSQLRERGIIVGLATGCVLDHALLVVEQMDYDLDFCVVSDGATTWDLREDEVVHTFFSGDDVRRIMDDITSRLSSVGLQINKNFDLPSKMSDFTQSFDTPKFTDYDSIGDNVYRLTVFSKTLRPLVGFADMVDDIVGDRGKVVWASDFAFFVYPHGVGKASALDNVARKLGVQPDKTLVFGDSYNDTCMFEWAGRSVAMGNSVEELKALATYDTLDNNSDGVAVFLEQMFEL